MAVVLLAGFAGAAQAQNQQVGQGTPRAWGQLPMQQADQPYAGQNDDAAMQQKRLNALNAERQKTMVADANKLVKLAAELNAAVNGKTEGQLTADQLRQVAEIEKLAHEIRQKMSTSVKPAPLMTDTPTFIPSMR